MNRSVRRLGVGVITLALVAGACGDDDSDSDSADTEAADTAAEAEAEASPDSASDDTTAEASETSDETAEEPAGTEAAGDTAATSDGDWDQVVAAAEEEGQVVLYSVMVPDVNERLEAAFSEAYPEIDMELIRVQGNEIDARLDAEEETGTEGADVVANVNYPWALTASEEGRLTDFVGPNATGPDWAGTEYLINDNVQLSTFANIGLGWNTDALPDGGPTSFEDLLDPEYAGGKIGLTDPVAPVVADFYATLEDNYGPDFVEQLAAQDPVFFPSAVPLEQALVAGEISVGGYVTNQGIVVAQAEGAPVEFASPENAWLPPILSYIPSWSARPDAAQVVIDFMASPEGQAVLGEGSFSPVPGVEGTFGSIEDASVADVQRSVEPGWYEEYYAAFNDTFGR